MKEKNITERIVCLYQQRKELDALYTGAAHRFKLSKTEFWVLYCLSQENHAWTQRMLVNTLQFPKQTVNYAVHDLKRHGILELKLVPHTRNQKVLKLTDSGKEFVAETLGKVREAELKAVSVLGEDKLDDYIAIQDSIIKAISAELDR